MNARSMDLVPLADVWPAVPEVAVQAMRTGAVDRITEADVARVMAHRPDILVRFGFNILRGPVLEAPPLGIWSFHHGDEEQYRGGPACFWEFLHDAPVTGAMLQRLTDKLDGGRVLHKGWFPTIRHALPATVDTVLLGSAPWVARQCQRVLHEGTVAAEGVPSRTHAPIYKYPTNGTFLRFAWSTLWRKLQFHWQELTRHEEWNIGVVDAPITALFKVKQLEQVEWMSLAPGTFRADPFGWTDANGTHILHELWDQGRGTAVLQVLTASGPKAKEEHTCSTPFRGHLSYPYTFQHEGRVYCVPESMADGRTVLFEVDTASATLREVVTLFDGPLADPTLFRYEGRWWLFGTRPPLTNVELVAYYAETLEGPYHPHALNPLKSDIRNARPAGTPFQLEGRWIRPAQDSSITYGGTMVFDRIDRLTPTAFEETEVHRIAPDPNARWNEGFHTVAALEGRTLVDGKRHVFVPARMRHMLLRKWRRIFAGPAETA